MSVLIKGMEMPKEAGKYRIEFDQCGNPYLLSDNDDGGLWHITTVPPHGRLIDADALLERANAGLRFGDPDFHAGLWHAVSAIEDAPTIIPAEPPKEET